MSNPTCERCKVELHAGFLPEATNGGIFATGWHPGEPTKDGKSWAQFLASPGGLTYSAEGVLAVEAWRCPSCGKLDLYANKPGIRGTTF